MPTVEEIKNSILAEKENYNSLDGLNSTSKVAIFNLIAWCVAAVIWVQYQFFDLFKKEVDQTIREQKSYTLLWFRNRALEFRHGHPLIEVNGNLQYSDEGYTEEEIQNALVISRAAVVEQEQDFRKFLFIKLATEINGELNKISDPVRTAIEQYFANIKPAGTKIIIFSEVADDLRLDIDFYYDPQVLTETGSRIDGANPTPVQDAIRNYIINLEFNGEFSIAELEDILQNVEGCAEKEAYIRSAFSNSETPDNFLPIESFKVADSGYMSIADENLTIRFKPKTVAL